MCNARASCGREPGEVPIHEEGEMHACLHTCRPNDRSARVSRGRRVARGRHSLGRDRRGRASVRQRQHRGNEHDRGLRSPRRRHADAAARLAVRGGWRRDRNRHRLAGRAAGHERRQLPARRRRRQQPDLGAADQLRRRAAPCRGRPGLLGRSRAGQHRGPR